MNDLFINHLPEFMGDEYECISAEMSAGDLVLHNGLTVHGAAPNFTNKRRRAMTMAMFPVGSRFNGKKNILTDEQFERYQIGEELVDINQNPILYSKVSLRAITSVFINSFNKFK
eukprot:TRINITY_DN13187_c0_g1_i1.p1 TRINITY_DN13187_c0_g1~~TRINITY_DN13187_c0_g1_i1.p1  ORF type:complete len:115 (+),score=11.59 TRINITY_DN13187_c0_g1_i1:140-484(+)